MATVSYRVHVTFTLVTAKFTVFDEISSQCIIPKTIWNISGVRGIGTFRKIHGYLSDMVFGLMMLLSLVNVP